MPRLTPLIIILLLAPTQLNAQTSCHIQGTIVSMGVGKFTEETPDGQGGTRDVRITYTQVNIRIDSSTTSENCIKKSADEVRSYGLCEDINIYKGDVVQATTETWVYGGKCLSDVIVEKR